MTILLLVGGAAVVGATVLAFRVFWPSSPDASTTTPSFGVGTARAPTTGQIARGVFWGMWLFVLSQAVVGAIALFAALAFGFVAAGSL